VDNLTHTVLGLVAGEAVARVSRSPRRASLVAIGILGGNLPDADLAVSYGGGKLGYLLQHRGYTHTLVGCVAIALLLYAAVAFLQRARGSPFTRREHGAMAAFAGFAVLLHLGMDALNNYGVHPFWPFDDRWFYGDVLFIVEPSFWIAAAPLVLLQRTRAARLALGLLVLVALVLNVVTHTGQFLEWITVTALVVGLLAIGRAAAPRLAALVAVAGCVLVLAMFAAGRVAATRAVQAAAAAQFAGEIPVDDVMTPGPMQPACWDVLSMRRTTDRYLARQANVDLRGDASRARCSQLQLGTSATAPWAPIAARPGADARVRWRGVVDVPLPTLAAVAQGDCRIRALLQFVRAPYVGQHEGMRYVGDLRFDREAALGFAELPVEEPDARCPRAVPWVMPRADLLAPP